MGHGNNQTRSAIPQAAWCQLNRGRIRRLLGCKALGADSGPSVRVRPTSGDILKHIRTDVAFPVGGMTEEKTYSGMNLCRESIGNYVMAFCKENGLGHELVDRSPSCKRVIFGERQKFCVHGIIGARQTGASNEHEHQTQFS